MRWERINISFSSQIHLLKNANPSKLGAAGNINLPIANAVFFCKEKVIKFVSFTTVMFQSLQSVIGCGIALGLGNTSLLMIHNPFCSKPWSSWHHPMDSMTAWLSNVCLTGFLRSVYHLVLCFWVAHTHFNWKIEFRHIKTEKLRNAKAPVPWHFIVCYPHNSLLRRCKKKWKNETNM